MRQAWVLVVASLLLGVAGCNTKSPLDAGVQTVSIALEARGQVFVWSIWDVNGNPNAPYCQRQTSSDGTPTLREAPVAWPLIVEISRILPGSTTVEVLASSIGTQNEFSSISPYDDRILNNPPDTVVGGLPATNGRTVTTGSLDYLVHCAGFSSADLPSANLLGSPGTFDIPVEQGTTIIVRTREQLYGDQSFPFTASTPGPPSLSGFTSVDGVSVTPDGTSFVSDEDGGGFTFSIRVR